MSCYCVTSTHISGCINHNKVSVAWERGAALQHSCTPTKTHTNTHINKWVDHFMLHIQQTLFTSPCYSCPSPFPSLFSLHQILFYPPMMGRVAVAALKEGWCRYYGLWLQLHPCNEFQQCKWPYYVEAVMVFCYKCSVEGRYNLDVNYKQTSLSLFSPIYIPNWLIRFFFHKRAKRRQKGNDFDW